MTSTIYSNIINPADNNDLAYYSNYAWYGFYDLTLAEAREEAAESAEILGWYNGGRR